VEEKITQRMMEDFNAPLSYEDKNSDVLEYSSQREEYNTSTFIEDNNSTFSPINTVARIFFHIEGSDISVSSFSAQLMGTSARLEEVPVIFQPGNPFGNDISAGNPSSFYVSQFANDIPENHSEQILQDYVANFKQSNFDKENRRRARDSGNHENEEHSLDSFDDIGEPFEDSKIDAALNTMFGLSILLFLKLLMTWHNCSWLQETIDVEVIKKYRGLPSSQIIVAFVFEVLIAVDTVREESSTVNQLDLD
jgi:hypothetical protein